MPLITSAALRFQPPSNSTTIGTQPLSLKLAILLLTPAALKLQPSSDSTTIGTQPLSLKLTMLLITSAALRFKPPSDSTTIGTQPLSLKLTMLLITSGALRLQPPSDSTTIGTKIMPQNGKYLHGKLSFCSFQQTKMALGGRCPMDSQLLKGLDHRHVQCSWLPHFQW